MGRKGARQRVDGHQIILPIAQPSTEETDQTTTQPPEGHLLNRQRWSSMQTKTLTTMTTAETIQ
jgi:hypothetical protein